MTDSTKHDKTPHAASTKKKTKLPFIGGVLVIVLGIAGAAYFTTNNTLERYNGDGYSMLVPKDFHRTEQDSVAQFTQTDRADKKAVNETPSPAPAVDGIPPSSIVVSKQPYSAEMPKSAMQAQLTDAAISTFAKDYVSGLNGASVSNLVKKNADHQGLSAKQYSFDITRDSKVLAQRHQLYVFGDKEYYQIDVLVQGDGSREKLPVDKILASLDIKK